MKMAKLLLAVAALLTLFPQLAPAALMPSGADDSAAIQAAIDGAGAGGTVTLGAGTFLLKSQLQINNGVTLIGQGWSETVLKYTGSADQTTSRVATIKEGGVLSSVTATGGKVNGNNECGGGILISGSGRVTWCKVTGNYAKKGQGGGIGIRGSGNTFVHEAKVDHTIVADNACGTSTYENYGGGIGVFTDSTMYMNRIEIDTCLVVGNTAGTASKAGHGGGIGFQGSAYNMMSAEIRNTTIVGNSAQGKGGGFYFMFAPQSKAPEKGRIVLVNNILANNQAVTTDGATSFADIAFATATIMNNVKGNISRCFYGLVEEVVGADSSSGDSVFVNASEGDYHLRAELKLGYESSESLLDLDGRERSGEIDVGCYAFVPSGPVSAPIVLDEPVSRPLVDYRGSAVSVAFTGDLPEGAELSAILTIGDTEVAGTVGDGILTFEVPGAVVTAGKTYEATVTFTVGDKAYIKDTLLVQGSPKVEDRPDWIAESASAFNVTGLWTGEKAVVENGVIAVSNATFTATTPSRANARVTVSTTMEFRGPAEEPLDPAARAGVQVVKVGGVYRYAFLTGNGVVTDTTVTANVSGPVQVQVELDDTKDEIVYTIGGKAFGPFAATAGAKTVDSVRYLGETAVTALAGAYHFEGLEANLAKAGDVEYPTVAEAVAQAGANPVTLLWDASWTPTVAGSYTIVTNGHQLAVGGEPAPAVTDNGDGTITVTKQAKRLRGMIIMLL